MFWYRCDVSVLVRLRVCNILLVIPTWVFSWLKVVSTYHVYTREIAFKLEYVKLRLRMVAF